MVVPWPIQTIRLRGYLFLRVDDKWEMQEDYSNPDIANNAALAFSLLFPEGTTEVKRRHPVLEEFISSPYRVTVHLSDQTVHSLRGTISGDKFGF